MTKKILGITEFLLYIYIHLVDDHPWHSSPDLHRHEVLLGGGGSRVVEEEGVGGVGLHLK